MGGRGLQNGGGGGGYPYEKCVSGGGGGGSLSHAEGGTEKVLG